MNFTINKIFSNNLCYYLQLNDKTQSDLVKFIGISSSTVSNWCTGKKIPRIENMLIIAKWLGVQIGDFLQEKNTKKNLHYRIF